MNLEITTAKTKKINLLTKFTLILFGIFATSFIFAITLKLFGLFGIWIGIGLSTIYVLYTFYFCRANSYRRIIAWGMLLTIIIVTALMIIGLEFLANNISFNGA